VGSPPQRDGKSSNIGEYRNPSILGLKIWMAKADPCWPNVNEPLALRFRELLFLKAYILNAPPKDPEFSAIQD